MKACKACGIEKPLTEYYKHSGMADGHLNICKVCKRSDSLANRNKNLAYYQQYDRSRMNEPQRIAARAAYAQSESGKVSQSRAKAAYIAKTPQTRRAHSAVSNAIRDGRLVKQPCEVCGTLVNIHAHHDDYSKPLDVRWLCAKHHAEWHTTNDPVF